MIQGIIFDLDGVLVHTDQHHYRAWKTMADKEGIYFDEQINHRLRGVSRMESLEIILERANKTYSAEEKIELATFKNNLYVEYLKEMSEVDVSKEVISLLDALLFQGIKMAIGSSSKNAGLILEQTKLKDYFNIIIDGNSIKNSKPDPEVFLLGQQKLGLPKERVIVVEDALAGVEAALRGGLRVAAIGDATKHEKADFYLQSISDLLTVIEKDNSNEN